MFFKRFREEYKLECLVGGLENAIQKFRPDFMWETNVHFNGAKKALSEIQRAHLEHKITVIGWEYIVKLCSQLETKALAHGLTDMARDCDHISDYSTQMIARQTKQTPPPDISREQALALFHQRYRPSLVRSFEITDTLPEDFYHLPGDCEFYGSFANCWFVQFALTYDDPCIVSDRLIVVSKSSGEIVYDDSASDEE